MKNDKRLIIFSEVERKALYNVPNFTSVDREQYFDFSQKEQELIMKSKSINYNIFCALQIGYFKAAKIFPLQNLREAIIADVQYIKFRYFAAHSFNKRSIKITKHKRYVQRNNIANLYKNVFRSEER